MTSFWAMGGYAAFIWPAFALTVLVLACLLIVSLRALRANENVLADLERANSTRNERSNGASTQT